MEFIMYKLTNWLFGGRLDRLADAMTGCDVAYDAY